MKPYGIGVKYCVMHFVHFILSLLHSSALFDSISGVYIILRVRTWAVGWPGSCGTLDFFHGFVWYGQNYISLVADVFL